MENVQNKYNLQESTIDKIQELIAINIDSSKGYEQVAEKADYDMLVSRFKDIASTRSRFASELQGIVGINGEEYEDSGSIKGTLHRWWIDVKTAVSGDELKAILQEAERGEDAIKKKYEEVIKEVNGTSVSEVLGKQYSEVVKGHDTVKHLRDSIQ